MYLMKGKSLNLNIAIVICFLYNAYVSILDIQITIGKFILLNKAQY